MPVTSVNSEAVTKTLVDVALTFSDVSTISHVVVSDALPQTIFDIEPSMDGLSTGSKITRVPKTRHA
eukprot:SAG31_NODE_38320_length_297_cov_0.762626_1_plen_66_part_10